MIRETVKVKVSKSKVDEMKLLLESMKTHGNYQREFQDMQLGVQQKYEKEGKNVNVQLILEQDLHLLPYQRPNWRKFKNSMLPDPSPPKIPIKVDYLKERRISRAQKELAKASTVYSSQNSITRVSSSIDYSAQAQLLDEQIKMRDQRIRCSGEKFD